MAYTRGRCTNVDYCSLAAAKRDIEVKIGQDFVCPECARPLRPPPVQAGAGRSGLVGAGIVGVLVLVAGGLYAGYRLSSPARPPQQIARATKTVQPGPGPAPNAAAPAQVAAAPPSVTAPAAAAPKPEQAVLLHLTGPALAAPLMSKLAAAYLSSLGDGELGTAPGGKPEETLVTGMRVGRPEAISLATGNQASGDGVLGLAAGQAGADAVALSPTYVVVNARNPLPAMTETQLRGVQGGSITRWSQLGGPGGAIHLIQSTDAAARVAADPDALSLLTTVPAAGTRALAIASLGARPALPTPSAVANGLYPLVHHITLTTPAGHANPFAARFAAFVLSPEGQDAVAQAGFVKLHVAPEAPPAPAAPPAPLTPKDRYRALVTGATRLAADLHFEPSSNKLDLHSAREVDRVWNFMMSDHTPSSHLVLMGFADNQGTPEANLALAQQRAQAVAEVFARRGLPPGQIVSFGSDLPVADNGTEAGREKNRRVEVFLRN